MIYLYSCILFMVMAISIKFYKGNDGLLVVPYADDKTYLIRHAEAIEALIELEVIIDNTVALDEQNVDPSRYTNIGLKLERLPPRYFETGEEDWARSLFILRRSFPSVTDDTIFALINCYRYYRRGLLRKGSDLDYAAASHTEVYKDLLKTRVRYFGLEWAQLFFEFEHGLAIQNSEHFSAWLEQQIMNVKKNLCQLNVQNI